MTFFCRFGNGHEKVGKVDFQVPTIGSSGLGIDINAELNVAYGHLDGTDETLQNGNAPLGLVSGSGDPVKVEEKTAQLRNQKDREGFVLMSFNEDGAIAISLGHALHLIEEHGFTDAAQTGHQDAFFGSPLQNATEQYMSLFQNAVAT
jgi:hypothetical protein